MQIWAVDNLNKPYLYKIYRLWYIKIFRIVCKYKKALHYNDIWYYLDTSDDEAITSELREEPSGVDLGGYARYSS